MDKAMLDKILAIPKDFLVISGGEPALARQQVKYIIEHESAPVSINTNLTMWQDEDFNMFWQHGTMLSVSVVSLNRDTYKKITGKDLVHKLKENLNKINRNARMTLIVNDDNVDEIESMVNYLVVRGFHNFIIQPAIPGMGAPFDYIKYQQRLSALRFTYHKHRNVNIERMSQYDCSCDVPVDHRCEAGDKRLVILSTGDVVPCACMPPVVLGNIMYDSWETLQKAGVDYFNSFCEAEKYVCKGFLADKHAREAIKC